MKKYRINETENKDEINNVLLLRKSDFKVIKDLHEKSDAPFIAIPIEQGGPCNNLKRSEGKWNSNKRGPIKVPEGLGITIE